MVGFGLGVRSSAVSESHIYMPTDRHIAEPGLGWVGYLEEGWIDIWQAAILWIKNVTIIERERYPQCNLYNTIIQNKHDTTGQDTTGRNETSSKPE